MRSHGFALNYKPGKTTATLALYGTGSGKLKQRTYGRGAIFDEAAGLQAPLALVHKHLGTIASAGGKLAPAVPLCVSKYRAARAPPWTRPPT